MTHNVASLGPAHLKSVEIDHRADLEKEIQRENALKREAVVHGADVDFDITNLQVPKRNSSHPFSNDALYATDASDPVYRIVRLAFDSQT